MSASAATIPCSRLPTAASPSATASSAASSCAWTCRRAKRNRDSRSRAVPGGAAQGSDEEPDEGEVAGPLLFHFFLEEERVAILQPFRARGRHREEKRDVREDP